MAALSISNTIMEKALKLSGGKSAPLYVEFAVSLAKTLSIYFNQEEILIGTVPFESGLTDRLFLSLKPELSFKDLLIAARGFMMKDIIASRGLLLNGKEDTGEEIPVPVMLCFTPDFQCQSYNGAILCVCEENGHYIITADNFEKSPLLKRIDPTVLLRSWSYVLEQCTTDIHTKVSEIECTLQEDKDILITWGKGAMYPLCKHGYLISSIQKAADKFPEQIAVRAGHDTLSYRELWEKAANISNLLTHKGVLRGSAVAVTAYRNVYTIAAFLGVLMSGCYYVPVEMDLPQKRIKYILEQSKSSVILCTGDAESVTDIEVIPVIQNMPAADQNTDTSAWSCGGYIIFTSGSTGYPKGVAINEQKLADLCQWYIKETGIDQSTKLLLLNSFGFDASVKNIFSVIQVGGELVLGPSKLFDADTVMTYIRDYDVSQLNCVPALFYELLDIAEHSEDDCFSGLQTAVLGGEQIDANRLSVWIHDAAMKFRILNVYGPTECTSVSTCMWLERSSLLNGKPILIGKPIFNKQVYVTDRFGKLCPKGATGELIISGAGVAEGYIGNNQSGAFHQDVFCGGTMAYNTGDYVYWNDHGELAFVGRKDSQIKLNGFRMEIGEIESAIEKCAHVKQAIVIFHEEGQASFLSAHIITDNDGTDISTEAADWLPEYMQPRKYYYYDEFPMTSNGKVDRNALKKSTGKINTNKCEKKEEKVETSLEKEIKKIWLKILRIDDIGYRVNFFDAGGYSLLLYKLKKALEKELGINVTFVELLSYPTIESFADFVESNKTDQSKGDIAAQSNADQRLEMLKKRQQLSASKGE